MEQKLKFAVIGGDMRQLVAARELAKKGFETAVYGFDIYEGNYGSIGRAESLSDALAGADFVLLPLPYSYDGVGLHCPLTKEEISVAEILGGASKDALLFAGRASGLMSDPRVTDYYEREEFAVLNAIPTAEGALAIVIGELPVTVHGMRVCITGFGRIGRVTAALFAAAGAEVTVFARRFGALAWAETYHLKTRRLDRLKEDAGKFDCLINTVPSVVFDGEVLERMREDALLLDLASKPGGVDTAAAARLRRHTVSALSLPGKTAPDTAGKIISETILNILCEKGVNIK